MQKVELRLPFNGEWSVFWGGDSQKQNAHHENATQKYALDFIMVDSLSKRHIGSGSKNSDYLCFGQDILAPAPGKVVEVVNGVRDNKPGETNPYFIPGNYVLIKHSEDEFSFLAHLMKDSIVIKEGGKVQLGQKIARCGNSGNSYEPHLHYHLQDSFVFGRFKDGNREYVAQGIKVYFKKLVKKGQKRENYSPVKNDMVEPA